MDISRDDTDCIDSYDISPSVGEYTGIAYDRETGKVWVAHNADEPDCTPTTSQAMGPSSYTQFRVLLYTSASGSSRECGGTYGSTKQCCAALRSTVQRFT